MNLKLLRKEYGISQQKLADALQISQQSINQYENHKVEPDIHLLSAMADYFDTSIDYIVGRTEVRRKIERTEENHLNHEETQVVKGYRALTREERDCVQTVIQTLAQRQG